MSTLFGIIFKKSIFLNIHMVGAALYFAGGKHTQKRQRKTGAE